ncbi:MAG: cupin domain-containing protein [Defluviicoccus sp.]|nr:cupin domain-containing protein [Defluviicoccus sp.]MDE0385059.1 cupin domain-containing protein [Defluviicoccus sp.]
MQRVKHEVPGAYRDMTIDELAERQVVRYGELEPDWDAFADSQIEGRRRAQFRLIGVGGSGKDDPHALPAGGFTLSMLIIPPGQGGSAHTHEVEEAFFVLEGELTVFFQDETGRQAGTVLRPYEVALCPAGIPHGFVNEGDRDALIQIMIGSGEPGPIGFVDDDIYREEVDRLTSRGRAVAAE